MSLDGAAEAISETEVRKAVNAHYMSALIHFSKWFFPGVMWPFLVALLNAPWLIPLGIIGCGIALYEINRLAWSLGRTWRCARIMSVYTPVFRSPVKKLNLHQNGRRFLSMGEGGVNPSPPMSARDPLFGKQWPKGIADGVWFAGDDAFGGAIIVPMSGELMCMQPRDWAALESKRAAADTERVARAKRAGLKRHTM